MSERELLYDVRGGVAWLTLNRESRRNALSTQMIDLFFASLDKAERDDDVRVICITGSGQKAFCSGADLASSFDGSDHVEGAKKYASLLKRMADYPKPLVAKVNGHCLAGGMGLMLSCDMVYVKDGIKIGTPEVNVGLFPMMIGALIFRNAGRKKAMEMIFTARMLTAAEAEDMGLITRAVQPDEFDRVVDEILETVAAKAPLAIKIGRQAFSVARDFGLSDALDYLCERLGDVVRTEDAKEGLTAFMQKREPVWKGR